MRRTHSSAPAVVGAQTRSLAERRGSVVATVVGVAAAVAHTLVFAVVAPAATLLALVGVAVGVAATA